MIQLAKEAQIKTKETKEKIYRNRRTKFTDKPNT